MKKSITLMLCISLFATFVKATNFYVDPVGGNDTGRDGLSWGTAVATISQVITLAKTAPYDVTVDNIFVKQGTMSFTVSKSYVTIDNIYGSCSGNETSPDQRPMKDLDGNGIIEPWEFQYPTIFSSTAPTTTALTLTLTSATFNGFTITHVPSASTGISKNISITSASTTFENNTIKNCNNTSTWTTGSQYGLVITALGTVKNSLFEKNQVYVSSSMNASALIPLMSVTAGSKLLNCIFRNNKVTIDYSASTSTNSGAGLKGMIINAESAAASVITTISNTLVYNNESIYIPGASGTLTTLSNGATVSISGTTGAVNTDSIFHCTIANNKTTKMTTGGLAVQKLTGMVSYVIDNALWNNKNDNGTTTTVNNIYFNSAPAAGIVANNFMNAGATNMSGSFVSNNTVDLNDINTDAAKGAQFTKPSGVVGAFIATSDSTTIKQADWRLAPGTYLIGKGVATPNSPTGVTPKDKAGVAFAATPSVGAYEYILTTPTISWSQNLTGLKVGDANVTLTATSDAGTFGSPITYTSDNTNAVTIAGNTLTIVAAGTGNVTAKQAANAYFNAAANVIQSVVVTDTSTGIDAAIDNKSLTIGNNHIISNVIGTMQVFTFSGNLIVDTVVNSGKTITLPTGCYIVRLTTDKGVVLKKIIL